MPFKLQTKIFSDADRDKSRKVRQAILSTVFEATELKQLAFRTAMALKDQGIDAEESDGLRAHAQAVTAAIKAWDMTCARLRIERGKPLPGSLRPESKPKKPKRTKAQATLLDQDQPAPAPAPASVPVQEP